ncbi:MAG: PilT/PilU family type 4a pilus ATPase [Pseudomonadota bacterium]
MNSGTMHTELAPLLAELVAQEGSDLFLSVGAPPMLKVDGRMTPLDGAPAVSAQQAHTLCYSIMNDDQRKTFEATMELNMGLRMKDIGRFRINVFRQQEEPALVARFIRAEIPSIEDLNLPPLLKELIMEERGLLLLVGGTGTGKSTTLASMVDYRNTHRSGHILTIEDPVEFVHEHKKSLVNQRDVGLDTASYEIALKNAMREAPDVIMIGEIRDQDTMRHALNYAETGHLCVSTLHANNAYNACQRILSFYDEAAHPQVLQDLSMRLKAIVSQRLTIGRDGKRVAAVEVMLNTPFIAELLRDGQIDKLKDAMVQARESGCVTFDDALFDLVQSGRITQNEALRHADSKTNLSLRFKLEGVGTVDVPAFKKDVAYARSAPFENYQTFKIRLVKVTDWPDELKDRIDQIETGIRNTLLEKGFKEVESNPETVVQWALGTKQVQLSLQDVDNPVHSYTGIESECALHGMWGISVVDTSTGKGVWRVTASRKIVEGQRDQQHVDADCRELLSEFPPL